MSIVAKKEIFNHLHALGCCNNCCVRYLCDKSVDFAETDKYIIEQGLLTPDSSENEEEPIKKSKPNPCIVCLGLLQDFSIDDILTNADLETVNEYDSTVFTCSISMPPSILLREHSMRLHLEEEFYTFFNDDSNNNEIPLNRAWKMYIKNRLAKRINKTFQNSEICNFSINITMSYEIDDEELVVLKKMQPKLFEMRTTQHRKFSGELFSRKSVMTALAQTTKGVFKMHGDIPPKISNKSVTCRSIECKHNCIYIAGRYCKYSRDLSQSPWIINGNRIMESSVQEIIFAQIEEFFKISANNLKFSSSGREDCDVRCLDKGRPFYIEMNDPKKTEFTFDQFRMVEKAINVSPLIKVIDLQKVSRSELVKIKEGEESKTKDYHALCIAKVPVTEGMINRINSENDVLPISQKTPIRVLHRRPLIMRTKLIHKMSAKLVEGKPYLFELHVRTQAGTYVKEFVHGDFGRTNPSIGDLISTEVGILALDVIAINLDWPTPVNYEL